MSNQEAASKFVAHLRNLGRFEDVDEARVTGFVAMAAELDRDPGNASLWKAYWTLETLLREDSVDDDKFAALLAELGDTEVVYAED